MTPDQDFNDPLNYEQVIKDAFPKAQFNRIDNFDDVHFGWEISPKPGHLIVFKAEMKNQMSVVLEKHIISHFLDKSTHQRFFRGTIPGNKDYEPDFVFLEQLLKNYESIG